MFTCTSARYASFSYKYGSSSLCACNTRVRLVTTPVSQLCQPQRHLPALPYRHTRRLASSSSQRSTKFREPRHVEKPAKMSWMDSWSRPSRSQSTPAPYYLLPGGESTPYCKTCGRVIGARKTDASKNATPAKYCSSRCKSRKPGALDRRIEDTFVAILEGKELPALESEKIGEVLHVEDAERTGREQISSKGSKKGKRKPKGDPRVLVPCTTVETLVFGDRYDPEKTAGRKRDRARRGLPDAKEWTSVDMTDEPVADEHKEVVDGDLLARMSIRSGTRIRPAQDVSEVNGGVGGEKGRAERIEENEEMLQKRIEGQQKAHERELVRCAARRGIAFGFLVKETPDRPEERRKCEAVMQGKVVEPSFAKGEWSVRWREEV